MCGYSINNKAMDYKPNLNKMKKKWMFCLSAVLLTFAACSDYEKGTDEQPGPIIGE